MSPENREKRVIAIEAEVAELKAKLATVSGEDVPWWKRISGIFADDPAFEEAMTGPRVAGIVSTETTPEKEERWSFSTPIT